MNTTYTHTCLNSWLCVSAFALGFLLLLLPGSAQAQYDDFNDGNDNGWTRYAPLAPFGIPTLYSFPNGGYRIQTTAITGNSANPGRAGSIRQDVSYTDFYVSVDLVNWNDNTRQAFGIVARIGSLGLGTTRGYSFTYDRVAVNPTSGGFDISRIENEGPTTISTGSHPLHLSPTNDYRFVFIGKGTSLEGRVYQLPNLTTPVLTVTATDATYSSGNCGLVVFDNSGGMGVTDATFDNYMAAPEQPPTLTYEMGGAQILNLMWPTNYIGYRLQGTLVLPPQWEDIDLAEDLGNGYWGVLDSAATGNKFYRLVK